MKNSNSNSLSRKVIFRGLLAPLIILPIVFLSAGKLYYWQGILYGTVTLLTLVFTYLSVMNNPELINERLNPGEGIKSWDKVYFALNTPLYFVTIILGSLDTGRLKLSPELPEFIYIIAVVVYVLGQGIFVWARRSNNYFSSMVRIQKDRGHKVCQEGPYRYIRHPGYLGGLLFTAAIPFILGSLWAMIPTGISLVLMVIRTILEDRTLAEELDGYKDYQKKVNRRILPFIW